jgi:hypothetical protein
MPNSRPCSSRPFKELKAENIALQAGAAADRLAQQADHATLLSLQEQLVRLQEAVAPAGQNRR